MTGDEMVRTLSTTTLRRMRDELVIAVEDGGPLAREWRSALEIVEVELSGRVRLTML